MTLVGVMAGFMLFIVMVSDGKYVDTVIPEDPNKWDYIGVSIFLSFIFGLVSASFLMEPQSTKQGRISMLMLPASQLEKFLLRWFIHIPFYIVVALVAFHIADFIRYLVCVVIYPDFHYFRPINIIGELLQSAEGTKYNPIPFVFGLALAVQSLFALGSTFFPRNALIKTVGVLIVLQLIYILYAAVMAAMILPYDYHLREPFGLTDAQAYTLALVLTYGFTLFVWVLCYYRFKESEIIERL